MKLTAEQIKELDDAGFVIMPKEPTPDQLLYAQGAMMDMSWDATTCFFARYQELMRVTKRSTLKALT
jgi:hypothetical protein